MKDLLSFSPHFIDNEITIRKNGLLKINDNYRQILFRIHSITWPKKRYRVPELSKVLRVFSKPRKSIKYLLKPEAFALSPFAIEVH